MSKNRPVPSFVWQTKFANNLTRLKNNLCLRIPLHCSGRLREMDMVPQGTLFEQILPILLGGVGGNILMLLCFWIFHLLQGTTIVVYEPAAGGLGIATLPTLSHYFSVKFLEKDGQFSRMKRFLCGKKGSAPRKKARTPILITVI